MSGRRLPRIEVVRTDAGWHGRIRAANGQPIWWTETYTRRRAVLAALKVGRVAFNQEDWFFDGVRDIDEREVTP